MRIEVVAGDITTQDTDAIVNAANSTLFGGGGVDGAIHAAAGPDLLAECRDVRRDTFPRGLPTGDAVATGAGRLAARFVIHTVGPQYAHYADGGADLLAACHQRSLAVAEQHGARSVAFPAISCGVYGWSAAEAAPIALEAVRGYARSHPESGIDLVRFVLFNREALREFTAAS